MCQAYLPILEALALIKEMLIAQYHPVISILKFESSNGALLLVAYQQVRGHAVIFLQFPGLLSTIFLLAIVKLHEYIQVI